jgi:hypothetical protein
MHGTTSRPSCSTVRQVSTRNICYPARKRLVRSFRVLMQIIESVRPLSNEVCIDDHFSRGRDRRLRRCEEEAIQFHVYPLRSWLPTAAIGAEF